MKSFLILLAMSIVVPSSLFYFKLNNKGFHNELTDRITFFDGFNGFPMFIPSVQHLVFESNRNQKKGEIPIFF